MVRKLVLFAAVMAAAGLFAKDWYVQADAATGGDGSSSAPFKTIQEAVDAASANDTIKVRPGVYDQGTTSGPGSSTYGQLSRVAIDKKISLIATEGRDKTVIYGGTNSLGNCKADTGLVSCVYIHEAAKGTVIRGFTLKGGSLNQNINGGGGVTFGDGTTMLSRNYGDNYRVEFCRIEDCSAKYGGGMAAGVAVGTVFHRNWVYSNGWGSAAYGIDAYDCLFTDNNWPSHCHTSPALYNAGKAVNCTFVNNFHNYGFGQDVATPRYYNVVSVENQSVSDNATLVIDTGVVEGSYDTANSVGVTAVAGINAGDDHHRIMMAPILGDYRPVSDGYLDKKGKREHLALIPEEYRNLDFNGEPYDSATADVPIGILLPAATPANGKPVQAQAQFLVNGRLMATSRAYLQSDRVPLSVYLHTQESVDPKTVFCYRTQQYAKERFVFADRNGGFWYTLAYDGTAVSTLSWITYAAANYVFYVDPENGADANDGKTAETAVETLSRVSELLVSGKYNVVLAAPGVYSNKVMTASTAHRVRLSVPSKCYLSLRATSPNGAADTIIEGQLDPDAEKTGLYGGCGPDACGGIVALNNTYVGVSGFTFRKCRTVKDAVNNDNRNRGAGVYFGNDVNQVLDCVFENCVSYGVGACVYGGRATRCLFRNNPLVSHDIVYGASGNYEAGTMSGCILIDSSTGYYSMANYAAAYNTTFYLPGKGSREISASKVDRLFNDVFVGGGQLTVHNDGNIAGCVVGTGVNNSATEGVLVQDPQIIDPANGDFRVAAGSCVLSAGSASNDIPLLGVYSTTDFYNNPLYPVAGGPIPSGASVAVRNPQTMYVSPDGDDENDGLTRETPMKTLKAVMSSPVLRPGDTVVAAEGDYDSGEMLHEEYAYKSGTIALPSRVVVPDGVTLVSEKGKVVTRIVGAKNVRAVFLGGGSVVRGFTIADGDANQDVPQYATLSDDYYGGGVLGRGADVSRVEDCDIVGNTSCDAPLTGVTIDRCSVSNNAPFLGSNSGVLMRECGARNSYINHNLGNATILNYAGDIVNCTIGDDNYNPLGKTASYSIRGCKNGARIVNTVVYQHHTSSKMEIGYVENSVLPGGFFSISEMGPGVVTNITFAAVEAMFNADGTPKFMEGSLAIDKGGEADVGALDLAGNPRIMNGCVDLGAFEADWRGRYGADMCKSGRMTVEDVSAGVVEDEGKVTIPADESMTFLWRLRKGVAEGEFQICATLSGDARLAVYVNGERIRTLLETGDVTVAAGAETKVRLVCESEGGEGSAQIEYVKSIIGTLMTLR